jgi:hypothetical protein
VTANDSYLTTMILVAAIACWMFAVLYMSLFPWTRTTMGRCLVAYFLGSAAVMTMIWLTTVLGRDFPYRGELRHIVYTYNAIAVCALIIAMLAVRKGRS